MQIIWQIDTEDIAKVKSFFDQHKDNAFVKMRVSTNMKEDKQPVTKEAFWGSNGLLPTHDPAAIRAGFFRHAIHLDTSVPAAP